MTFWEFLASLHIRIGDVIAGLAGGTVHAYAFNRSDAYSKIGSVVVGCLTSTYLTESVVNYAARWFVITDGTAGFIVGLCGMSICQAFLGASRRWKPAIPPFGGGASGSGKNG